MHSRFIGSVGALLVAFGIAACSGDSTGPAVDTLTDTEFDAMVQALSAAGGFDVTFGVGGALPSPAMASASETPAIPSLDYSLLLMSPETVSISIEESVPCPEAGSVDVAGSMNGDFDSQTGAGSGTVQVTQTHRACTAVAQGSGKTFVFDGRPNITTQVSFSIGDTGELISLQGTQSGGFEWAVDDKRGFCGIQLAYSITGAQTENPSISIGGTLCERTFDFQIQG